jgi:aminoglycoside/choline kinase family phosphotransferase
MELDFSPLERLCGEIWPGEPVEISPMTGGASTRKYFRVTPQDGGKSVVAMFVPDGPKPEEIQNGAASDRWPFLEVRDLLAARGVDVPSVFAEDTARGWLLLEDLGEDTLANYLSRAPNEKAALYTCAVRDLAEAQASLSELPSGCVVGGRSFDVTLLRWEIDHFREWGLDARGKSLSPEDRAAFDAIADRLAERVSKLSRGFTHRDYQSRNLMVRASSSKADKPYGLVWIDFQDALLGPRVYDLVALLNDSYQTFSREFVEARLAEYAEAAGLDEAAKKGLVTEFDLVTVQRKLKDAGRFVFIDRQKKNPSFLKFVTPTVAKVGKALDRLASTDDDMKKLRTILERVVGDELSQPVS